VNNVADALADDRPGLDIPWPELKTRITARPGTLIMAIGAPGALKSMFSLSWALGLQDQPSRLISLDTNSATQGARIVGALTGTKTDDVFANGPGWADWLRRQPLMMRVTDRPVDPKQVGEIVAADREYWGIPPALVVIDDLKKLILKDYEKQGLDAGLLELHRQAKKNGNVVLVLHHVVRKRSQDKGSGWGNDAQSRRRPVALFDAQYTGEYEAEIVLGVWRPVDNELRISILKNRNGEDDPAGQDYVSLYADAKTYYEALPARRRTHSSRRPRRDYVTGWRSEVEAPTKTAAKVAAVRPRHWHSDDAERHGVLRPRRLDRRRSDHSRRGVPLHRRRAPRHLAAADRRRGGAGAHPRAAQRAAALPEVRAEVLVALA
jgi:hypothetical protein